MNLNELPKPDINKLKDDLKSLLTKYKINKFAAEDIVELLEGCGKGG